MYNDYSIYERLLHMQSQSATTENSATGRRHIHHRERASRVLLFVREFKADRITGGAAAYTFLGTASDVKHEGSRAVNITGRLDRRIPAKFLQKTNKLVVRGKAWMEMKAVGCKPCIASFGNNRN